MNKRRKLIITLDIIYLICAILGVLFLTTCYAMIGSNYRYLLLLGDVLIFTSISFCIKNLDYNLNCDVYKYSNNNIEGKYIKKLKVTEKTVDSFN